MIIRIRIIALAILYIHYIDICAVHTSAEFAVCMLGSHNSFFYNNTACMYEGGSSTSGASLMQGIHILIHYNDCKFDYK